MGDVTNRSLKALTSDGSLWKTLAILGALGGGGSGVWAAMRPSEVVNKELIEYRLGGLETAIAEMRSELAEVHKLVQERLPRRDR